MVDLDFGINFDWSKTKCELSHNMTRTKSSEWLMNTTEFQLQELKKSCNDCDTDQNFTEIPSGKKLDIDLEFKISMLCGDQLQVFYHVMSKIKEWVEWNILSDKKDCLPKIVNDKQTKNQTFTFDSSWRWGSGKSTLVKVLTRTIRQIFQCNDSVLVAAPTGSASFNEGGVTMHRFLEFQLEKLATKLGLTR